MPTVASCLSESVQDVFCGRAGQRRRGYARQSMGWLFSGRAARHAGAACSVGGLGPRQRAREAERPGRAEGPHLALVPDHVPEREPVVEGVRHVCGARCARTRGRRHITAGVRRSAQGGCGRQPGRDRRHPGRTRASCYPVEAPWRWMRAVKCVGGPAQALAFGRSGRTPLHHTLTHHAALERHGAGVNGIIKRVGRLCLGFPDAVPGADRRPGRAPDAHTTELALESGSTSSRSERRSLKPARRGPGSLPSCGRAGAAGCGEARPRHGLDRRRPLALAVRAGRSGLTMPAIGRGGPGRLPALRRESPGLCRRSPGGPGVVDERGRSAPLA